MNALDHTSGRMRSIAGTLEDAYNQPSRFAALERYWNDPAEPARVAAECCDGQARIDALFADHDADWRAKQAARWAAEDAATGVDFDLVRRVI